MKKILSIALCAVLTVCMCALNAAALSVGPYTANANTYYINPDTGVTDDGGSKNAAVGEGMCRSVIGETALIEYDGSRTYATVRVMLLSNLRSINIAVQQTKGDSGSYKGVSPEIMAEDAENDCADYRFEVPESDSYVRFSAYVIPMSRNVTFYLNVSGNMSEGGGDFVVSVQKSASSESASSTYSKPAAETSVKTENKTSSTESGQTKQQTETKTAASSVTEQNEKTNSAKSVQQADASVTAQPEETVQPDESVAPSEEAGKDNGYDVEENKDKDEKTQGSAGETKSGRDGTLVIVIVIATVIVLGAGGVMYFFIRRKIKNK